MHEWSCVLCEFDGKEGENQLSPCPDSRQAHPARFHAQVLVIVGGGPLRHVDYSYSRSCLDGVEGLCGDGVAMEEDDEDEAASGGTPPGSTAAGMARRGFEVVGVCYAEDEGEAAGVKKERTDAVADMRLSKSILARAYAPAGAGAESPVSPVLDEFCIVPHQDNPEQELRLWKITHAASSCQFGTMATLGRFAFLA